MWFKNLKIYQFTSEFKLTDEQLNEQLASALYSPCSKHQISTYGWISPLKKIPNSNVSMLVHTSAKCVLISAQEEQKILPSSVINDLLHEKISEIELKEGYKVGKKQKDLIKEELVIDLLPRAFSKYNQIFAYIDRVNKLLIVDAASNNKAEQLTEFLRKTIGSLSIVPITPVNPIEQQLTSWLKNNDMPKELALGENCELKDPAEDGGIVRCSKHNLISDEIIAHIDAGKLVTKLALTWNDKIEFVLHDDLSIKRLKLTDTMIEDMDDNSNQGDDDAITRFDADLALMTLELSHFIPEIFKVFNLEITPVLK